MEGNISEFGQQLIALAIFATSIIVGVIKYVKTEAGKPSEKATEPVGAVVAASFVDSKLLRELIDTLREHQEEIARVASRETRSNSELREAIIESTEALRLQTDATLNMIRFITRQSQLSKKE